MRVEDLLRELDELGIQLESRGQRLYCPVPASQLPDHLLKAMCGDRDRVLQFVQRRKSTEAWVYTPDGPGKIAILLNDGRKGVVLRRDIESKPRGQRPIRFYESYEVDLMPSRGNRSKQRKASSDGKSRSPPMRGVVDESERAVLKTTPSKLFPSAGA